MEADVELMIDTAYHCAMRAAHLFGAPVYESTRFSMLMKQRSFLRHCSPRICFPTKAGDEGVMQLLQLGFLPDYLLEHLDDEDGPQATSNVALAG